MALIKCPECGERISDRAVACIMCGYPIRELGVSDKTEKEEAVAASYAINQENAGIESINVEQDNGPSESEENDVPNAQLLEYLEHAIELEGVALGEQTIIDDYRISSESLKPTLVPEPYPAEPRFVQVPSLSKDDGAIKALGILCYLIAAIVFCIFLYLVITGGEMNPNEKASICAMVFGFAALSAVGGAIFMNVYKRKVEAADSASNENYERKREYEEECAEVEERNKNRRSTYNNNLKKWQTSTEKNIFYLTQKKEEVTKVLEKYYEADVIFPKYHTLPALTSIYEYLTSGRCKQLTGPNGAYNLYEMEVRQNTVIEQLNTIISNLEQIRRNQFVLYQELTKVTTATRSIANEISQIRDYSKQLTEIATLNTYYTAVAAQSASAIAFMEMMG